MTKPSHQIVLHSFALALAETVDYSKYTSGNFITLDC